MKTTLLIIAAIQAAVLLVLCADLTPNITLSPDALVERTLASWLKTVGGYLPKEDWATAECRKNIKSSVGIWREISGDVLSVNVSKTQDTDTYVIQLIDSKGRKSSLWLNQDGTVNSISSY